MWNAFVQRRNGGGYDERSLLQVIELNDDDCKLLMAAGLKIQKGASPRDLYCFQYLPSFYDGTPLQVLRLLEEVRSAGRKVRKAEALMLSAQSVAKRPRLADSLGGASNLLPSWAQPTLHEEVENADESDDSTELPEVIKIAPSTVKLPPPSTVKLPPSPVKRGSVTKGTSPARASMTTPVKRRSQRTSMKIDVVSEQEESSSSRKASSTSTSPLAKLFSPTNIRTPSPGLKTRRSSVLKQFETPEQPTGSETPQTVPAPPKRLSTTTTTTTEYTVTTTVASDVDDDEMSDGLVDDAPEDDERACCDVKSVVEPLMDALQRTSSRFQNAWEEVRALSSSLVLIPVSDLDADPSTHVADVRDDGDDLLVLEDDADESSSDDEDAVMDLWSSPVKSSDASVRTRRQRQATRRFGVAFPWRLW